MYNVKKILTLRHTKSWINFHNHFFLHNTIKTWMERAHLFRNEYLLTTFYVPSANTPGIHTQNTAFHGFKKHDKGSYSCARGISECKKAQTRDSKQDGG